MFLMSRSLNGDCFSPSLNQLHSYVKIRAIHAYCCVAFNVNGHNTSLQ
jgi:hypothetical protein